ncbi:MAG: hypothetical protein ACLQAT_12225 [Candidatus Binataceae bacterium]
MARGDIKAGKGAIVGSAGEYFAMAELLRKGWLAGLTPRGTRDYDIIATKDAQTIHVRVKTKTADSKLFRWNLRQDGRVFRTPIGENDFCILVDIGGATPEYFLIPTPRVEVELQQIRSNWLAEKATRNPTNRVIAFELGRHDRFLSEFKNNWSLLPSSAGPDFIPLDKITKRRADSRPAKATIPE